jgi:Glycosyltransferase family 87
VARAWARRDPLRDGYLLASLAFVAAILAGVHAFADDARAYWLARLPDPYAASIYGAPDAFYYSPPVAQLLAPLTLLPWPVFYAGITAVNLAVLWWLVGRWAPAGLLLPFVAIEMFAGNINLWLAAAMVLALGRPALWAFPILTKVTPGLGVLWHVARLEGRAVAVAAGSTLGIAAVSCLLAPDLWRQWFAVLAGGAGVSTIPNALPVPLVYRAPLAIALVLFAGRTDRAWLVPVAVVLATPVIWPATFSLLLAVPRLRRMSTPPTLWPGASGSEPAEEPPDQAGTSAPRVMVKGTAATTVTSRAATAPSTARVAVIVAVPAETPVAKNV